MGEFLYMSLALCGTMPFVLRALQSMQHARVAIVQSVGGNSGSSRISTTTLYPAWATSRTGVLRFDEPYLVCCMLPLCDLGPEQPVAIGDQMPICFFLSTNPPKKMVFRVQVEQYAELVLKGSQAKAIANDRMPIYTWAAVTGSNASLPLDCSKSDDIEQRSHLVSCPQVYATSTRMAHMLNLVVNLRDGKLSSFAWDNGCAGCGPDACIESKKSIDIHTGAESGGLLGSACGAEVTGCTSNDVGCDMKVFVTWAGTDKDGRHATSAGMRMSKFTGYTLTSLYEKANQNYKKVVG